jgi:transcription initiation factor IIE alpha subunit
MIDPPSIHYQICERLDIEGEATNIRLANDLGRKTNSMSSLMQMLENRGHVKRKPGTKPAIWQFTGKYPPKYGRSRKDVEVKFYNQWAFFPLVR